MLVRKWMHAIDNLVPVVCGDKDYEPVLVDYEKQDRKVVEPFLFFLEEQD